MHHQIHVTTWSQCPQRHMAGGPWASRSSNQSSRGHSTCGWGLQGLHRAWPCPAHRYNQQCKFAATGRRPAGWQRCVSVTWSPACHELTAGQGLCSDWPRGQQPSTLGGPGPGRRTPAGDGHRTRTLTHHHRRAAAGGTPAQTCHPRGCGVRVQRAGRGDHRCRGGRLAPTARPPAHPQAQQHAWGRVPTGDRARRRAEHRDGPHPRQHCRHTTPAH